MGFDLTCLCSALPLIDGSGNTASCTDLSARRFECCTYMPRLLMHSGRLTWLSDTGVGRSLDTEGRFGFLRGAYGELGAPFGSLQHGMPPRTIRHMVCMHRSGLQRDAAATNRFNLRRRPYCSSQGQSDDDLPGKGPNPPTSEEVNDHAISAASQILMCTLAPNEHCLQRGYRQRADHAHGSN